MSEAKLVVSAENRTRAAFAQLRGDVDAAKSNLSGFQGAVAAGFALAPVAAFTAGMSSAIGELDRLGDQAPKVGLTAQALAELGYGAKLSGSNTEALEGSIGKLSVKMSDIISGSKEAARGFDALGIKVTGADGKLKATDKVLGEIADRFAKMEDGPLKTALAIELFGKSGKEMIPLLNNGAAGIDKLRAEFVKLTGGPITEATAQAQDFRDNMDRLATKSQGFYMHVAGEVLPLLNTLAEKYLDASTSVDSLGESNRQLSTAGAAVLTLFETTVILGSDVAFVMKGIGTEIGGITAQMTTLLGLDFSSFTGGLGSILKLSTPAAAAAALVTGNWKGFSAISDAMKEDTAKARAELEKFQNNVLNAAAMAKINKTAADLETAFNLGGGPTKTSAPVMKKTGGDAESEYEKISKKIRERIALADQELKAGRSLTDQEKFAVKVAEDVANAKGKLTAVERERLKTMVQTSAQTALALEVSRSEVKQAEEAAAARQRARNADYDAVNAFIAEEREKANQRNASLADGNKQLKEEIAVIGLSKQALADHQAALIQDTIAQKQSELARLDQIATIEKHEAALAADTIAEKEAAIARIESSGTGVERAKQLRIEIELLKERKGLISQRGVAEAAADAAEKVRDEWKKTVDDIDRGLTDALMDGFKAGEDRAKLFRDTVVNMFRTMVLRPTLSAIVQGGLNTVGLGGPQQGGGPMGLLNSANSLNSLVGAGSQFLYGGSAGASTASLAYANGVGMAGGDSLGALIAGNGGWAGVSAGGAGTGLTAAAMDLATANAALGVEAGLAAGEATAAAVAAAEAGAATTAAAGTFTTALAAIGPIGWIALAGIAAYAMFGGEGGGPKVETGYADAGLSIGDNFKADQAAAKGVADSLKAAFDGIAKSLGVTSKLGVAYAESRDPQGDSQTQLQVASSINGEVAYNREARLGGIENVGREDADIAAARAEEFTRALYGGLLKSDLAEKFKTYLSAIAPDAASSAELQRRMETITLAKRLSDAIGSLGDDFSDIAGLSVDAEVAFVNLAGGIDAFLSNVSTYFANFYSEEEQRAQQARNIADSLNDAVGWSMTADQVLGMSRDQFRALVDSLDLSTESGKAAYAAMMQVAGAFAQIAPAATSAAEAAKLAAEAARAQAEAIQASIDAASEAFDRALNAERKLAEEVNAAAQERADQIREVFAVLGDSVRDMYGEVESTRAMSARAGRDFIDQALTAAMGTGYLPDASQLTDAIAAAQGGIDPNDYSTKAAYDRDRIILANRLKELQDLTGTQLTTAEQMLDAAQQQIKYLDGLEVTANELLDEMKGIGKNTLSAVEALNALREAIKPTLKPAGVSSAAPQPVGASGPNFAGIQNTGAGAPLTPYTGDPGYAYQGGLAPSQYWADKQGTWNDPRGNNWQGPAFAGGTSGFVGGMALVGEQGEELVELPPQSRVYTAGQTRGMLGGDQRVASLLSSLLSEVVDLRAEARSTAINSEKTFNVLDRLSEHGDALRTVAA